MTKDSIFKEAAVGVFLAAICGLVIIVFVQIERHYVNKEIDAAVAVYKRELQVYEKILTNPALCDQYEYKGRDR